MNNDKINAGSAAQTGKKPSFGTRPGTKTSAPESGATKQDLVLSMLRRSEGVTIPSVMEATGWQAHSVRGFFSSVVRKKLSLPLTSDLTDGVRVYRTSVPKPVRSRSKKGRAALHPPE